MAHNPKLEVYQVWLKPQKEEDKTYRDFFVETNSAGNTQEDENSVIFLDYFSDFIRRVDTDDFIANSKKKKAFTAYDTRPVGEYEPTIKIKSNSTIIEGTIEGGRYGQKRNKSSVGNKSEKEDINEVDIILDKFYFCLYTPLNSDLGILFIQSYSADTISDIFTDFIRSFFFKEGIYKKAKVEKFVPNRIVDEFRNISEIKKFAFSSRFVFDQMTNEPIGVVEEEFIIKVEVVSKNGLPKESLGNWINSIGSKVFSSRQLAKFNKGKVYLKNTETKKESPFDIDSDFDIKPIIYLEGRIAIEEDGLPNFEQLSDYCVSLLENEIIPEMYITNEVQER